MFGQSVCLRIFMKPFSSGIPASPSLHALLQAQSGTIVDELYDSSTVSANHEASSVQGRHHCQPLFNNNA